MTRALVAFNAAAFALTLAGGSVNLRRDLLSKLWLWRLFALRSGVLLAVAFVEILPEALRAAPLAAAWGALAGFTLLFALESLGMADSCPEYLEECSVHLIGAAALGALFAHSFIDGFNLSASFLAGAVAGATIGVAMALHKLIDGFTLTALLAQGGYSPRACWAALTLIAAATPLGSLIGGALCGASPWDSPLIAGLLGFAAGSFVYIGAADVLPRLHKGGDKGGLLFFAGGLAAIALLHGGH